MKRWQHLLPALYGLLIYGCIRLITDTASGYNVLMERHWGINTAEIIASILVGYPLWFLLRWYEKRYQIHSQFNWKLILKEFLVLAGLNTLIMNATITVLVANTDNGLDLHDFVVINLIPLFFVFIFYSIRRGNYFLKSYVDEKLKLERIEKDKIESEMKFLKSQYHPHFLFNALNTVYFQMDESKQKAKETIEKLSDLLRYQLYEDQEKKVMLKNEFDFIKRYSALQKERMPENLQLDINLEPHNGSIYPLLFAPLVENAFKYANGDPLYIRIEAKETGKNVCFEVANTFQAPPVKPSGSGIGLLNLKRRLELLYPGTYQLEGYRSNGHYIAQLSLPIQ